MRLIDADELINLIENEWRTWEDEYGISDVLKDIADFPTVEPKQGHWKENEDECECTLCHSRWNYVDNCTETFKYCPNCGAKMDEVTDG